MIRLSRIWKLYIIYTVALVVCMTLAGFFLDAQIKRRLQNHLEEDGLAMARLAVAHLPQRADVQALERFCRSYRETAGWRMTLVDAAGSVIADSHEAAGQMDSHRDRSEIQTALAEGRGTAVRSSPTLGRDMLYAAVLAPEVQLVVRVAMPMSSVKAVQNEVMRLASVFLYLAPLVCAVISFFTARALVGNGHGPRRPAGA
jgi:two-component system phosphate regulon sensor histidine kinase PhoR